MNANTELLNYVYQNSQMGMDTIGQLLETSKDVNFNSQLESQREEYMRINTESKNLLNQDGQSEKGIGAMNKVKTYLTIGAQTMTDKSTSHVAEMLITGSTMGVIDSIKKTKEYTNAAPEALGLMDRLRVHEEGNLTKLKEFL